jgi:hypothetical protein
VDKRIERGKEIEGYAFTFCKAAFLTLLLNRYTLLVTAAVAAILYGVAYAYGVREWRCFVKPPWVVIAFGIVAAFESWRLFVPH